jgi:hypothetical protein
VTCVLLIRPRGPHTSVQAQGTHFVETSVDQLTVKASARSAIMTLSIGAIVLEDLRFEDLDEPIRRVLITGASGSSCPIVTRWTTPRTGNAL